LLSHINRCGVLDASDDHKREWMDDTLEYLSERYPALSAADIQQLRDMGLRFCQPVIPHGKDHTASRSDDANAA